jgi:DNA-directed RNA polymerase subunit E'
MFYVTEVEDYIRVEPKLFGIPTIEAVEKQLQETYADYYDKEFGKVVAVIDVLRVGEGVIIPGDGAVYYVSRFKILTWKPELHELVYGTIAEITTFGAFMDMGTLRGMIHISQTMEDYVSFSKSNTLLGKSSKRSLKQGDLCIARIVAISHRGEEPKIGLTMRQPGLGKIEWVKEDLIKKERNEKKVARDEERAEKGGKGKKGGKGGKGGKKNKE